MSEFHTCAIMAVQNCNTLVTCAILAVREQMSQGRCALLTVQYTKILTLTAKTAQASRLLNVVLPEFCTCIVRTCAILPVMKAE